MPVVTLTIDENLVSAREGQMVLEVIREQGIAIPTLCYLKGLSEYGGCRLCLVEVAGSPKLLAACVTTVQEGMIVQTDTERLRSYRQMTLELLLAERNHICSVCVMNGHCELQTAAADAGVDSVRFEYLCPDLPMDMTHEQFGVDHNRCILCTRCVRVCSELEGAHTWGVMGRGHNGRVITGMKRDWGQSTSCTSCGKCVQVCPTGTLFKKGSSVSEMEKRTDFLSLLVERRKLVRRT